MYLFRSAIANTIAKSNANLLTDISFVKKKTVNLKIKSILNDCSQVILLLNQGQIDDADEHKNRLSTSSYYNRPLANTIFDKSKEIYHLIDRTLKALPLDNENCHDIIISKEGYVRPRSP